MRKKQPKTGGKAMSKPEKKQEDRTPEEVAEERIASWKRREPLDLSGLGLTEIPASLRSIPGLEILSLPNNKITELPSWLGELRTLRGIDLSGNRIRTLRPKLPHCLTCTFCSCGRISSTNCRSRYVDRTYGYWGYIEIPNCSCQPAY